MLLWPDFAETDLIAGPDGPLPQVDPIPGENTVAKGRASVRMHRDPVAVAGLGKQHLCQKGVAFNAAVHDGDLELLTAGDEWFVLPALGAPPFP